MAHWKEDKSSRHVDSTERRIDATILPSLGNLQIADMQAPDVVAMVRGVEVRGVRDVAKRALETTGQIFRYAIAHGYATRNPAADIKPRDVTRLALKLMALTFVRTGELIAADWSEIDFEEKRWNIPAERMKMRTAHIVPLSDQAIECCRRCTRSPVAANCFSLEIATQRSR